MLGHISVSVGCDNLSSSKTWSSSADQTTHPISNSVSAKGVVFTEIASPGKTRCVC